MKINNASKFVWILILSLSVTGCSDLTDIVKSGPEPGKYIGFWSNAFAVSQVLKDRGVDLDDKPDNPVDPISPVIPSRDCNICNGKGFTKSGDGISKIDCVCDFDGDGDPDNEIWAADIPEELNEELKVDVNLSKKNEVKIDITYGSQEAIGLAQKENKDILVYLSPVTPQFSKEIEEALANYIVLYGDISNKDVAHAWASLAPNKQLVVYKDGEASFTEPVFCFLDSDGEFKSEDYYAVGSDKQFLNQLKSFQ